MTCQSWKLSCQSAKRLYSGPLHSLAANGLELSCPAEAGRPPPIVAHDGGPGASPNAAARRVSFSELLCGASPPVSSSLSNLVQALMNTQMPVWIGVLTPCSKAVAIVWQTRPFLVTRPAQDAGGLEREQTPVCIHKSEPLPR